MVHSSRSKRQGAPRRSNINMLLSTRSPTASCESDFMRNIPEINQARARLHPAAAQNVDFQCRHQPQGNESDSDTDGKVQKFFLLYILHVPGVCFADCCRSRQDLVMSVKHGVHLCLHMWRSGGLCLVVNAVQIECRKCLGLGTTAGKGGRRASRCQGCSTAVCRMNVMEGVLMPSAFCSRPVLRTASYCSPIVKMR